MNMNKFGTVIGIYTAPDKGVPMQWHSRAALLTGKGVRGDRYALEKGAYSHAKRQVIRHVTLMGLEELMEGNDRLPKPFSESDLDVLAALTRRNILTYGVDLHELVDHQFAIGRTVLKGVELDTTCMRPERLAVAADVPNMVGFEDAFQGVCGIRAEVVTGGLIRSGDGIYVE